MKLRQASVQWISGQVAEVTIAYDDTQRTIRLTGTSLRSLETLLRLLIQIDELDDQIDLVETKLTLLDDSPKRPTVS